MAKGKNMLGKFRGKVGATVFRTEAGIGQIASEYNPNPKNPRTNAQTKQRTKMNLAGLISSMANYQVIAGLDTTRRACRSKFVSEIIKRATVTGTGTAADPFKATVAPADIVFSHGRVATFVMDGYDYTEQGVHLTGAATSGEGTVAGVIGVAISNKDGKMSGMAMKYLECSGENGSFSGYIPMLGLANDDTACVYIIPIFEVEGAAGIMTDIDVDWVTNTYGVSVARSLSTANAYGKSQYIGLSHQEI
jgi:hypothetical protein